MEEGTRSRARILVVDDQPANVELLEAHLVVAGYEVVTAADGVEALEQVAAVRPDLILLDIMMPRLDGFEVCRRLKADEGTVFIPIVMVTSLKEVEERVRAAEVGADDFITKPFNKVELLARVRSLLRIKGLHDQLEAYNRLLEVRVTERTAALERALQDLRKLDKLKSEFVANVSHELRTPLTPIKGYLSVILQEGLGPLTAGQKRGLQAIQASTDRLGRLIEDLLTFVRLEKESLELRLLPTPLAPVLEALRTRFAPLAEEKGQTLTFDVPADLPAVLASASDLELALQHLLDNAVKFTPAGGQVTVVARAVDREPGSVKREDRASERAEGQRRQGNAGQRVEIGVRDTGIGIPPGLQARIFDRFYQVDSSTTRAYGGVGLGLTIVKQILEAHGAQIAVESVPGQGATFRFQLPAAPPG